MEAFKERLIQEYNELNERIGKLDNFFTHLSDDDVSKEMVEIMGKTIGSYERIFQFITQANEVAMYH